MQCNQSINQSINRSISLLTNLTTSESISVKLHGFSNKILTLNHLRFYLDKTVPKVTIPYGIYPKFKATEVNKLE